MVILTAVVQTNRLQHATAQRWLVLMVLSLATFIIFLDNTVINTALPSIARDLNAPTSALQWLVDAYTLPLAGLLLLGGAVGDRYGRRRCLTAGLTAFTLAAVGAALSSNFETLILMRGLQGVGAALILPATLSTITAVFPRAERAKAIGVWAAVSAASGAVGPLLGGWMVDQMSWTAVFWLHVPLAAVVFAGLRAVPETKDGRSPALDLLGALLVTGGLLAVAYGIIHGSRAGWTAVEIVCALALGAAFLAGFVVAEMRSRSPMLPLEVFKRRDFIGPVMMILFVLFGLMVMYFFLTQYFQLVQGKSAFTAGLYILPSAGATILAVPVSGALSKRLGPKALTVLAALIIIGGVLWLAQLQVDSGYLTVAIGLMPFGLASGLALVPLTDTVMAAVPVNHAGIGAAINYVSRQLGAALGVAVIGSIVNDLYSTKIESGLAGLVPLRVVEAVSQGIGATPTAVDSLEVGTARLVTRVANEAFVDAFTTGFYLSAGFIGLALVIAVALVPWKMHDPQADDEEPTRDAFIMERGGLACEPAPEALCRRRTPGPPVVDLGGTPLPSS